MCLLVLLLDGLFHQPFYFQLQLSTTLSFISHFNQHLRNNGVLYPRLNVLHARQTGAADKALPQICCGVKLRVVLRHKLIVKLQSTKHSSDGAAPAAAAVQA